MNASNDEVDLSVERDLNTPKHHTAHSFMPQLNSSNPSLEHVVDTLLAALFSVNLTLDLLVALVLILEPGLNLSAAESFFHFLTALFLPPHQSGRGVHAEAVYARFVAALRLWW